MSAEKANIEVMTDDRENSAVSWRSSALHVVEDGVIGDLVSSILSKMQSGVGRPDTKDLRNIRSDTRNLSFGVAGDGAVGGLRTYLSDDVGDGYWDFVGVCSGMFLSVTDAQYRKSHRIVVPAEPLAKIRVVCSGSLYMVREKRRVADGTAFIQWIGGNRPFEYVVNNDKTPFRMVVLHILPGALENIGMTRELMPENMLVSNGFENTPDGLIPLDANAKLIRIARDILDSRTRLLSDMRQTYLRGKAYEILCETLLLANPITECGLAGNCFRQKDRVLLCEAERILASNLSSPPTIDQLSRLVGLSKTKLTAGFREFFGETVKECQSRLRLTEALRLIDETDIPLNEIGRTIGFDHPANFTQFVRRHVGTVPRRLRQKGYPPGTQSSDKVT